MEVQHLHITPAQLKKLAQGKVIQLKHHELMAHGSHSAHMHKKHSTKINHARTHGKGIRLHHSHIHGGSLFDSIKKGAQYLGAKLKKGAEYVGSRVKANAMDFLNNPQTRAIAEKAIMSGSIPKDDIKEYLLNKSREVALKELHHLSGSGRRVKGKGFWADLASGAAGALGALGGPLTSQLASQAARSVAQHYGGAVKKPKAHKPKAHKPKAHKSRAAKGSEEAKEKMAHLRSLRKGGALNAMGY